MSGIIIKLTDTRFDDMNLPPDEIADLVLACLQERVYTVDDERFVTDLTVTVRASEVTSGLQEGPAETGPSAETVRPLVVDSDPGQIHRY